MHTRVCYYIDESGCDIYVCCIVVGRARSIRRHHDSTLSRHACCTHTAYTRIEHTHHTISWTHIQHTSFSFDFQALHALIRENALIFTTRIMVTLSKYDWAWGKCNKKYGTSYARRNVRLMWWLYHFQYPFHSLPPSKRSSNHNMLYYMRYKYVGLRIKTGRKKVEHKSYRLPC